MRNEAWHWGKSFFRYGSLIRYDTAGRTLGLRAPDCAKEPLALWTLFIWVVMWVRFTRRRALGDNEDLTGLRSFCACHAFLSKCPVFDHACCLTLSAKQTGLRYLAFLFRRGSRSPFVRSRGALRLSAFVGSLRACAFSCGDPDGGRRRRGNAGKRKRRGTESAVGRKYAFA